MDHKIVLDMPQTAENGRNSEGSFLRSPDGAVLYAYSRFNTGNGSDDAPCDICMIRSYDEGETWSKPVTIATARELGVTNIMSVSGMSLKNGNLCFFFIVLNDSDGSSCLGRTVSEDGFKFTASLCKFVNVQRAYYVFNNDRFIRLSDGRIAAAAAKTSHANTYEGKCSRWAECYAMPVCFVSDDEGESFTATKARIAVPGFLAQEYGMEEPGIIELPGGVIWLWARTTLCYQYQCYSLDGMNTFTPPEPSIFTSPRSPLELHQVSNGDIWAAYNPVPHNNATTFKTPSGRTPLVVRKSSDNGRTWGPLYTIERDPYQNYCYPAMFETKDGCLLLSYMQYYDEAAERDGTSHDGITMRIVKIFME